MNKGYKELRIPPHDAEAEAAVLGAMMLQKEAIGLAIENLREGNNMFYYDANQIIYEAILQLYEKDKPVDLVTLSSTLKDANKLEKVGDSAYLIQLLDSVATAANIEYYAQRVLEKALLRNLIDASTRIVRESYEGGGNIDELLDRAEQQIFTISERRLRGGFIEFRKLLYDTFEHIEEMHKNPGFLIGVPSGFDDLDKMTGGFQKSNLIIIAGRPSMGKTALALNIAENMTVTHNVPVALFSLEMSQEQLAIRLLCSYAKVNSHKLQTGRLPNAERHKLGLAAGPLFDAPLYIDDTPNLTVLEMRAKARRLKSQKGLGAIIVDYLQLMEGHSRAENRQQEISKISRSLKGLAMELEIPVIALSQLSRAVELRTDKRPQLSDLRESGAIEQDADVVMFVYRREYYFQNEEEAKGKAEIIIGKQRNGPVGTVQLFFHREFTRFEGLSGRSDEPSAHDTDVDFPVG